jgi:hypothetical protein
VEQTLFGYECCAHQVLTPKQIEQLENMQILSSSLDTIEACGGGSADA